MTVTDPAPEEAILVEQLGHLQAHITSNCKLAYCERCARFREVCRLLMVPFAKSRTN